MEHRISLADAGKFQQSKTENDTSLVEVMAVLVIGGIGLYIALLGLYLDNLILFTIGLIMLVASAVTSVFKALDTILNFIDRIRERRKRKSS